MIEGLKIQVEELTVENHDLRQRQAQSDLYQEDRINETIKSLRKENKVNKDSSDEEKAGLRISR